MAEDNKMKIGRTRIEGLMSFLLSECRGLFVNYFLKGGIV